jgi:hypothetical protein
LNQTGGLIQAGEHLLCKCEALSSKPSTIKERERERRKREKRKKK